MQMTGAGYLFGLVVDVDAAVVPGIGGDVLFYVYDRVSEARELPADLHKERLLLPPMIANRSPWTAGYLDIIEHRILTPADRFDRHCFRDTRTPPRFYDEHSNELDGPLAGVPVGLKGVHSYASIDDDVSRVLGLPTFD